MEILALWLLLSCFSFLYENVMKKNLFEKGNIKNLIPTIMICILTGPYLLINRTCINEFKI